MCASLTALQGLRALWSVLQKITPASRHRRTIGTSNELSVPDLDRLGGAVAWYTALTHPCRVEKLILVDASGYPDHPISVPIGFRLARVPALTWLLKNTLPRSLVKQGLRNVFGDPGRVTQEMIDRAVELNQRKGNRQALADRLRQSRPGALFERIRELRLPALILWGGRDRLIPPEDAERFHRDIIGSTLMIFDDLGHAPEEEDPTRTVEAVKRFLDC